MSFDCLSQSSDTTTLLHFHFLCPPPSSKKGPTDENFGISYLIVIIKFVFSKFQPPPLFHQKAEPHQFYQLMWPQSFVGCNRLHVLKMEVNCQGIVFQQMFMQHLQELYYTNYFYKKINNNNYTNYFNMFYTPDMMLLQVIVGFN